MTCGGGVKPARYSFRSRASDSYGTPPGCLEVPAPLPHPTSNLAEKPLTCGNARQSERAEPANTHRRITGPDLRKRVGMVPMATYQAAPGRLGKCVCDPPLPPGEVETRCRFPRPQSAIAVALRSGDATETRRVRFRSLRTAGLSVARLTISLAHLTRGPLRWITSSVLSRHSGLAGLRSRLIIWTTVRRRVGSATARSPRGRGNWLRFGPRISTRGSREPS